MPIKFLLFIFFSLWLCQSSIAQRTTLSDFGIAYHFEAYHKAVRFGEQLLLQPAIQQNQAQTLGIQTKLGISYFYLGDYQRGLFHLETVIKNSASNPNFLYYQMQATTQKGVLLLELNQVEEAKASFLQVIALHQKKTAIIASDTALQAIYARTLTGMATCSWALELFTDTEKWSRAAILFLKKETHIPQHDALVVQNQLLLASVLMEVGNFKDGQELLHLIDQAAKENQKNQSLDWVTAFEQVANYYLRTEDLATAIIYNQYALKALLPEWQTGEMPSSRLLNFTNLPSATATVLAQRGEIQGHKIVQQDSTLRKSLQTYQLLDVLLGRLRRTYTDEEAQLLWSQRALHYHTVAIKTALRLYANTQDESYKEIAFQFSERSKSNLLLGAYQKTKAQKIAQVPAEILQKEQDLKEIYEEINSQVASIERKRFRSRASNLELDKLKTTLQISQQAYEDYLLQLQKQYPAYYQLKYDLTVVSIATIQANLDNDQLLLEYFITNNELIVFKISNHNFEVITIALNTDLEKDINAFRESIYGYYLRTKTFEDYHKELYLTNYKQLGEKLYQTLLDPVLRNIHEDRLTIILAGHLGFLPFEALLTDSSTTEDFREMPYLVNKYAISYCYSATLLHQMQEKAHQPEKIFLGFSPSFDEDRLVEGKYKFNPLTHSRKEVSEIFNIVDMMGQVYDGEQATKQNFKDNCEDYCIVHVATHGAINNNNSDASFLAFSGNPDSTNQDELLYVRELYNMNMTAELVVLSACETGVGELIEAEGIASLARGFSYAGAKSIVTSLWEVNDYATAQVMQNFYTNLQEGLPKDKALQAAKLQLIRSAGAETAHPFLWSAFVQIGNQSPLPQGEKATKKEGSFILNLFGMLHWILVGVIVLAILWAIISSLFSKKTAD